MGRGKGHFSLIPFFLQIKQGIINHCLIFKQPAAHYGLLYTYLTPEKIWLVKIPFVTASRYGSDPSKKYLNLIVKIEQKIS